MKYVRGDMACELMSLGTLIYTTLDVAHPRQIRSTAPHSNSGFDHRYRSRFLLAFAFHLEKGRMKSQSTSDLALGQMVLGG